MIDPTALIQIKGLRDGLLVTLGYAAWEELRATLIAQVDEKRAFFQGARMALDVGEQVLHVSDLVVLRDQLSERGISLWAVVSESPTTETTAQLLGLATRISRPQPGEYGKAPAPEIDEQSAVWVARTLRSGTRIEFPGHVVVFGDVNPGAEITAGGNVLVWGRLRGVVHAGAQGNADAVVCALELAPTQLRIADEIAVPPEAHEEKRPEMVFLKDGHLVAEPWQPGQAQSVE